MNNFDIDSLLQNYKSGHSLEQAFYLEHNILDLEWERIWASSWLFAGTLADIPLPGDFFTYQAKHDSIIVIRGDHGEIFAHFNTCRHRGSLVCLEHRGNAPALMCPYHHWVYKKDGSLAQARLMPDDFDKAAHGLPPVQVRVVEGLIFISLAHTPPDFAPIEADYAPFLRPFQFHHAKVAARKTYNVRANWKLVAENFRECYHCGPAHPEYCSAVIGANLRESPIETLAECQPIWNSKGLATETVPFRTGTAHFAVRYPLRPGVQSYSTDGRPVAIPMGAHRDFDAGVLGLVVLPGFWMDAVSDYAWTMRLTPLSPSRTQIDLTWIVDGDAVEHRDYTPERLTEFWRIVGEQDWVLCENNFRGVESSRYAPGPYAPDEQDVADFVDWYIRAMKKQI